MSNVFRVLVFPGGTEIGLEIRKALAWCSEIELFSAGSAVPNHAPFAFERHYELPSIHETGWVEALNVLVQKLEIEYIFPAYDDVLLALAENAPKLCCKVITSPLETCRITRSKLATYAHLAGAVPVPVVYPGLEAVQEFPVFLKPDKGQGSQNVTLGRNGEELRSALAERPERIILEYLPGEEYTVDCFCDRERGLLFCSGRIRRRIKAGIAMNSEPVPLLDFEAYARRICERLQFYGAWFFQLKQGRSGELKLLEVAPRVAGTSAVSRAMGVNLPLLSLYEARREPITIPPLQGGVVLDRALVNRYKHQLQYRTMYVGLEDTVVVRGQVNPQLMTLLFEALNKGVRLVLVSRENGALQGELHRHRLSGIFDQTIQLRPGEPKSAVLTDPSAILVDASQREREEVRRNLGIPVFDVSMIEVLLNDGV